MRNSQTLSVISFVATLQSWTVASIMLMAAFIYLLLALVGLAWTPDTCITETRERIEHVWGFDFEIRETDCDTLAKTATIGVFASLAGRSQETLIFKLFPAYVDLLPSVAATDEHAVQIFISKISSLYSRKYRLDGLTMDYKIDTIDYPDGDPEKRE